MTIWTDIQREFKQGNTLTKYIFINIAVFLLLSIIQVFSWAIGAGAQSQVYVIIIENIQTYNSFEKILLKPWTLVTYMFTHEGFLHLLFNMIWLYWMGRIFIDMLNSKRFIAVYILGGIFGALFATSMYYLLPVLQTEAGIGIPMIGASASVLAIIAATATYFPNYNIYMLFLGRVPLKYLALGMIALDIIFMPKSNTGGHLAHIGGALFGFIWAYRLKQGTDIAKWFILLVDRITEIFKPKSKLKVSYRNKKSEYVPFENVSKAKSNQAEIDAILDKISKSGYENLTTEEKQTLFNMKK